MRSFIGRFTCSGRLLKHESGVSVVVQEHMKNGFSLGQSLADYFGCVLLLVVLPASLVPRRSAVSRIHTAACWSMAGQ